MSRYTIRFDPEYFATSLWSVSDSAKSDFGYNIAYEKLELSEELIKRLERFDNRVMNIIDWSDPKNDSPMTPDEQRQLYRDGKQLLAEVSAELGSEFEVLDNLDWIDPDKHT